MQRLRSGSAISLLPLLRRLCSTLPRYGVTQHLEVLATWTPHIRQRSRTFGAGSASVIQGIGDITLGVKQSSLHSDRKKFSLALESFVIIPTADVLAAWIPKALPMVQFDCATYVGLDREMPNVEALIGVSKRF